MSVRVISLLCPLVAALIGTAHALVPDGHNVTQAEPNRIRVTHPQAQNLLRRQDAWRAFTEGDGAGWMARFDEATGTPHRAWGPGIPLRDVSTRAALDASIREIFVANAAMLGVPLDTLRLRTAAYIERLDLWIVDYDRIISGVPIWRGGVTLRIRGGDIVLFGVDTYPAWSSLPAPVVSEAEAIRAATLTGPAPMAIHTEVSTLLEAVPWEARAGGQGGKLDLKLVYEVRSRTQDPLGKWVTLVDATNGEVLTTWNEVRYFDGTIYGYTNTRTVDGNYSDSPMPLMTFSGSNGATVTAGLDGSFSLTDGVQWTQRMRGSYATVNNQAGDEGSKSIAEGDTAPEWTTDDATQAEIDAYKYVHDVRAWGLAVAPEVAMSTSPLTVNVNLNSVCNAYFDGAVNFYEAGSQGRTSCNNTGQIADVVYHEWGHGFHYYSLANQRDFDGSISEGISDVVATLQTHDSAIGPYFFTNGAPVRDVSDVRVYPDDMNGEVHDEGMIFGGAMWDTWEELLTTYGERREDTGEAWAVMSTLLADGIKAGPGIADSYDEMVVADDDDGDITNGTPHLCELIAGFGRHGLGPGLDATAASLDHVPLGNQPANTPIALSGSLLNAAAACNAFTFAAATVHYSIDGGANWSEQALTVVGEDFTGEIPGLPDGTVVSYYLTGESAEGDAAALPQDEDRAPYTFYVGGLTEIYCTTFEDDDGGYTHALLAGDNDDGADDWMWGTPIGLTTDPTSGSSGRKVWGNDLGGGNFNGEYQSDIQNRLTSIPIPTAGNAAVVVQYRRWLGVEDASFDQARVYANDALVWENHASDGGEEGTDDQEWKLHTFRVEAPGDTLTLAWDLTSDRGVEYGGWNIDDVCVYAPVDLNGIFGIDDFVATDTLQHEVRLSWTHPSDPGAVHATVIRRADRYAETRDDVGEGTVVYSGDVAPGSAQSLVDPVDGVWYYSVFAGGELGWLSGADIGANADEGTGLLDGEGGDNSGDGNGGLDTGGGTIKINAGCGCATGASGADVGGMALLAGLAGLLVARRDPSRASVGSKTKK